MPYINLVIKHCRLLQYLDLFLDACLESQEKIDLAIMGKLLEEIFSGGPSVTLQVKEKHIVKMMKLFFSEEPSPSILQALMKLLVVRILACLYRVFFYYYWLAFYSGE